MQRSDAIKRKHIKQQLFNQRKHNINEEDMFHAEDLDQQEDERSDNSECGNSSRFKGRKALWPGLEKSSRSHHRWNSGKKNAHMVWLYYEEELREISQEIS